MTDDAPGRFAFMKTARFGWSLVAAGALALAGVVGWWFLVSKPEYDVIMLRANATSDLFALYDLQMAHQRSRGAFADDLEVLLKTAPDGGTALRARLQAHTHLDTLVVAGGAADFKLEANVRDAERTLLRVKGPRIGDPIQR